MSLHPRAIASFSAEGFQTTAWELEDGSCNMMADMDIDVDGIGDSHGDPYFQPDTTLHFNGKALNSDVDKFIVLPPPLIRGVAEIVLGCYAKVYYRGHVCEAVVGDVGPTRKVGEASRAVARVLGINQSPINGGVDDASVRYEWFPGKPATVDGRAYSLRPHRVG